MLTNQSLSQKNSASTSKGTGASEKVWFIGALNMLLVLVIMFFAEVSSLHADGLFDFQMTLANKGNAEAQYKVGEMYETGFGVKKDMKQAELWIQKAAGQGHETAGFKLLYWDMTKNGMKGGNRAKYDAMLKKADAGEGHAMLYVGKMYAHGVGVEKNYDKALDWLNKATFIGVLEAEREAVAVREEKQRALADERRKEENRKAAAATAAAAAAAEKRLEDDRKKQSQSEAEESRKRENAAAANAASAARGAEEGRLKAEQETAEKEKKRQALLKQRAEQEEKRKTAFESDPCSGKSARFLSTCK